MSWSFSSSGSPEMVKQAAAMQLGQPFYATLKQPEQATIRAVQLIIESTCDGARPGSVVSVNAYGSQNWNPGEPHANQSVQLSITTSG